MKKLSILLLGLMLSACQNQQDQDKSPTEKGGGATGVGRGGNPSKVIAAEWNPFDEGWTAFPNMHTPAMIAYELASDQLKPSLKDYFENWLPGRIFPGAVAERLEDLMERGLVEDLNSEYVLKPSYCELDEKKLAGVAQVGIPGSQICLGLAYFDESQWGPMATWAVLAALAVHEHAHHLEVDDRDHLILKSVATDFAEYLKSKKCSFDSVSGRFQCVNE